MMKQVQRLFPLRDADANAFLNAQGNNDATQSAAINALVVGLKADGLWSLIYAAYPFVGGSASMHKWNLKDPRDLDAAYRMAFIGGVTHNASGITFDGSSGYGDTFAAPGLLFTTVSGSFGFYRLTDNSTAGYDMGCADAGDANAYVCISRYSGANQFACYTTYNSTANGDARGFYTVNKNGGNTEGWKNSIKVIDHTDSATLPNVARTMKLACEDRGGTILEYKNATYAFAYISQGMTATQQANLYTRIQTFQTALGRQV